MRPFWLAIVLSIVTSPPIALSILERTGTTPFTVRTRITLQSDARNRELCLDWTSETASGSSCQTVDGVEAPITFWKDITFHQGGDYLVVARVERNDNSAKLSNIETIRVLDGR